MMQPGLRTHLQDLDLDCGWSAGLENHIEHMMVIPSLREFMTVAADFAQFFPETELDSSLKVEKSSQEILVFFNGSRGLS